MFREFHTLGAATGKARDENTVVAGDCCSNEAEADHRFLIGRYSWRLLKRYAGCPESRTKCYGTKCNRTKVAFCPVAFCPAPFDHGGHCPLYSGGSKTVVASMMKYDH